MSMSPTNKQKKNIWKPQNIIEIVLILVNFVKMVTKTTVSNKISASAELLIHLIHFLIQKYVNFFTFTWLSFVQPADITWFSKFNT